MHDDPFEVTIEAARAGAEWAWARLYREVAGPIVGYLASRGARDAEGLASETFLQAARNIDGFDGNARAFRSWLFVIAHRRLIDERRRIGRRPAEVPWSDRHAHAIAGGDVEREAIDSLVVDEIVRLFEILTEEQRDVMSLRIIGGLTVEETAAVVGKRIGAVKALQRRALSALRATVVTVDVPL